LLPSTYLARVLPSVTPNLSTRSSVRIRVANFTDYEGVARLELSYFGGTKNKTEWKHLWVNNPVYNEQPDWPIGWVLETREKEIVGYVGNVPLSYEFQGRRILAATSRAVVVDLPYRAYSLALLGQFFGQKKVDLFLETTVNPKAAKAQAFFRARRVPVGAWNRSDFWITEYRGFLVSLFSMKGLGFVKPLAYPLSAALQLKSALFEKKEPRRNCVEIGTCTGFDSRFDTFWQKLRSVRSSLLLATRTREVLEWHFNYALKQNRALVATVVRGNAITAYAVLYRQDNVAWGLKRMRLVDFQSIDGTSEVLTAILRWALEYCRNGGIHMLETIGLSADRRRAIEELTPHKRELPCWMYFYKTDDTGLAQTLEDPERWDPSCFDGDASL
jgi:hypothetical protein